MILLRNLGNIFKIPELTRKIIFTLGVFIVYRIGTFIPAIGVNAFLLKAHWDQKAGYLKGFLSYFDTFSGGDLSGSTIFALGISPYITASIMMQILSMTIPSLEILMKEGDYGRKIINQYTRYLAVVLSIGYSFGWAMYLVNQNMAAPGLLYFSGFAFTFLFVLTLTTGAIFVMWLGEQISLFGIGSGSGMIIFAGIVARLPSYFVELAYQSSFKVLLALLIIVIITLCIVFLEKGDRKIPVQYARRIIGQRVYGGQSTYIPFKINTVGVMPVIFATSVIGVPAFLFTILGFETIANALRYGGFLYSALEFALIIFFTYFYTAIQFNPTELADNIKKSGGFIPGIRPGKQTADYFDYILNRIGLVGAVYLGLLAVAPDLLSKIPNFPKIISGTSLLIMVGVALETSAQIEAYLIERRYEGFLSSGRIKG